MDRRTDGAWGFGTGCSADTDSEGKLRIDRGYVNPEDEPPAQRTDTDGHDPAAAEPGTTARPVITVHTKGMSESQGEADEDDGLKPLSERLITELTAHLAHCAALTINAVHEPWNRNAERFAHADALARAVNLDMAAAGWKPTVDNHLGRVPKARILDALRAAKGEASSQLIDHLKKPEMAKEAERLLADTGWLPEPLRTTDAQIGSGNAESETSTDALPAFLADGEDGDPQDPTHSDETSHAVAAE